MPRISSVLELLRYRASDLPAEAQQPAFTFLHDGGDGGDTLTFAELDRRARNIAAHIRSYAGRGDRVLLVYPPGLDYIAAFFGCVYAGAVAVPAPAPANARSLPRLRLIAADAGSTLALSSEGIAQKIAAFEDHDESPLRAVRWVATDRLGDESALWTPPDIGAGDTLFLQYTSGSTGAPKGVMVSHGNFLANAALSRTLYEAGAADVAVSWLPPHHDFGLIGMILFPVYVGCRSIHFSPAAFLMRPYRWLKAVTDHGGTITGAPNFAYDLCARKVTDEQKQALDLGTLRVAINGAERVRYETLRRFADAFAGCGFRAEAMTPSYGLAESTLIVSGYTSKRPGLLPRALDVSKASLSQGEFKPAAREEDTAILVSTGRARRGAHRVAIVDPATSKPKAAGQVGEVWVSGASVASGYWNRPEETAASFSRRIEGRAGVYLQTGDLGFVHEDELYISGRIKEIMIFGGRNIYPQDVEATVEKLSPAFRENGCAVFSLEDDARAELVIVQEVLTGKEPATASLIDDLRAALSEQHELVDIAAMLLVKAGAIPRTTSGKIQRGRARELFLSDGFSAHWSWRHVEIDGDSLGGYVAPRNETEEIVARICCEVLGLERVGVHDNFVELGGHSLLATQVMSKLRSEFAVDLPLSALFEDPTVAAVSARLEAARREGVGAAVPAIERVGRDGALPLSLAQQRLWFLDQLEPGNPFYNIPAAVRLRGVLDVAALRRALGEIVRRHEALRARFVAVDGTPAQVIAPMLSLELAVTELSGLAPAERESQALAIIRLEALTTFDLARGPLIRASLVRLGDRDHLLLCTMHHIVSDGWSMGVLTRETCALYNAFVRGAPSPLASLPLQYADYASWQRQWMNGAVQRQQLGYWTRQLSGAPPVLNLPTDRPRPAVQTYRGSTCRVALCQGMVSALSSLAARSNATLFMVLNAAFTILLSRYSGQTDICIGTFIANRNRPDVEDLIGFFVNMLVLRTRLEGDPSFLELLDQVRRTALDAYAHQDVPFEHLVEHLKPERHLSHTPVFQAMLVLQNTPTTDLDFSGLTTEVVAVDSAVSRFDLTLRLTETDGELNGCFEYSTDLFDAATIARLAGHFERLLESIVARPEARIGELELLGEEERRLVLSERNPAADSPMEATIPELFEAQVERAPDAVAVVHEGVALSYGELNGRANRLAHHLRSLGVGPDVLVGLCVERSLEMVVGLLGILKAGGAYVPLDPDYPARRLAHMLEDVRPALVLAQAHLVERLPDRGIPGRGIEVFGLELDRRGPDAAPAINPARLGQPQSLACVIPGSGSTGRPKGTMLTHANVQRLLAVGEQLFGFDDRDVWTLFHSFAFDLSVWEIWGALLHGGKLVVVPYWVSRSPQRFHRLVSEHLVTVLNQTPSAFRRFIEANALSGPGSQAQSLRWVILGGEVLNRKALALWFSAHSAEAPILVEMYGMTEATVHVTLARVPAQAADRGRGPIGRPRADLQACILDATGNLVPPGVPGELHIGGAGLARGYVGRAGLTAESFVPNPHGAAGSRMYRTGDRARYRPDGAVEHLGRIDDQVKVRGFLIELGEVEAALAGVPGVREAVVLAHKNPVVLAHKDHRGDKGLVAYVVAAAGPRELDVTALRAALGRSLPNYMVPSRFVVLDELPLTADGTVDRKALPAPELAREALEETVARDGALPLSFAQQRLWFLDQLEPGSPLYNMPIAVRMRGALDMAALQGGLNEVVQRHEVLRTRFVAVDGAPIQAIDEALTLDVAQIDLSGLTAVEREKRSVALALQEARTPFDLASSPLIRASLLRLGKADHVMLLTMPHIVSDAWSMEVLVREVAALYGARAEGRPSPLPDLAIQYAGYAQWQRRHLAGEILDEQVAYWKGQLSGAPELLSLPTDRPRHPVPSYRGARHGFAVPAAVTRGLHDVGRRRGATLLMTLAAALSVLLSRYGGQKDICIGTPVANRRRRELKPLIGLFVNTLVLRTRLGGDPSFLALLDQVRRTALDAFANQDVPFEHLVDVLKPARHRSHSPLFQVMLAVHDAPPAAIELPGLMLEPVAAESGTSKFDLSFDLTEVDGGLAATIEYAADLFDASTIGRLAGHFCRLLESIVATPEARIGALDLLGDAERRRILVEWNAMATAYPPATIAALFEAQVGRTPDGVAVVHEGEALSYGELNARSNRLAHHLRGLGVGPDVMVGLFVERSLEMVVGLLAVLKAGGAYLPLDPDYPLQRLAFMVSDAAPALVLTQTHLIGRLPGADIATFCLDRDWHGLEGCPETNPAKWGDPQNLAYVIYTSGSTGRPKGVAITHDNAAALVAWAKGTFSPAELGGVLASTSICFDLSVFEIFVPLAVGGAVLLARTVLDLPQLERAGLEQAKLGQARLGQASAVTMINTVPSAMGELIRAGRALRNLRVVNLAGEMLPRVIVDAIHGESEIARVLNLYGPSEDTTYSTFAEIPRGERRQPPIGRPIGNTQIYLLDEALEPVPIGVAGELHIAGSGLARGYLNRPDLTAERFIPNPYGAAGSRMYRTGDLARHLADGTIEYLGCADHQVKIHGYRIELGEVEAALSAVPGVREAVVVAREDHPGDKRLVAYVVMDEAPAQGGEDAASGLRRALRQSLPDYMVPPHFVVLEGMPLTASGKVDRKALPAPGGAAFGAQGYVAPRTPIEEAVAQIWSEVLRLDRVGVTDNFFEIGGHSLQATRVVYRVEDLLGVSLPLRTMFDAPTIERILDYVFSEFENSASS